VPKSTYYGRFEVSGEQDRVRREGGTVGKDEGRARLVDWESRKFDLDLWGSSSEVCSRGIRI
jgi:hypothetical protein